MAINVDPVISRPAAPARGMTYLGTDYKLWKALAWCGPVFLFAVFVLWGILARNMPPFPPSATGAEVKAHFQEFRTPLLIGLSLTLMTLYMAWSVAVSRLMDRVKEEETAAARLGA